MNTDRIDFISAYCDRWCERCAFTSRCSAYATEMAIAMCGDVRDGLELAHGVPHPEGPAAATPLRRHWAAGLEQLQVTPRDEAGFERVESARRARVEDTSIMKAAWAFTALGCRWLKQRHDPLRATADQVVAEALLVAMHDATLITVKLSRALHGRDEYDHEGGEDPVQNDWNGTAKVALMSIARSEGAWRTLADATGDETPGIIADQLHDLRHEVEAAFPQAWSFVRPGFDEPRR